MKLTKKQLKYRIKYEIDLSKKIKKRLKQVDKDLKECQNRMVKFNSQLNKLK